ncbi:glycoside hydrolase family protein [Saccharicrinis fermentans]|uniref:glycoside hydrolase family protein n=1 Tax=Saccharicrinis fermentans TaxID=982 RepID=UPI00138ADDD5|nr:peptidoglycan DD-metalloendopeptidase family protein [Saccharicrinis fermentans]
MAFVKQMMRLGTNYDVIFPLDIKPQNDKNNSTYNGKEWYASAESNGTTFGASRDKGARKHAGRDLYASWGTPIRAMADGEVIEMTRNWFNNVGVISIAHKTTSGRKFICRYGEVDGSSIAFKKGQKVMQGDFIARIGFLKYPGKNKDMPPIQSPRGLRTNMLHFEFYSNGETHADIGVNLSSNIYRRKRTDLTDPLEILKEAYENSFEKAQPEKPNRVDIQNLRTSDKGIEFIKLFEGTHKSGGKHVVYDDHPKKEKAKATIGYGHLVSNTHKDGVTYLNNNELKNGISKTEYNNGIDENRADELLRQDLVTAENGVKRHIKVPLSQNEFDALVSLSFNSGADRLGQKKGGGDTQIKTLINKGEYYNGIDEIADITNGNTAGLVKRRQAEMTIFKSNYYAIKIP